MQNSNKKTTLIALIAVLISIASVLFYNMNKLKLADDDMYKENYDNFIAASEKFTSDSDMRDYIKKWARKNNITYITDNAGNIIFSHSASADSKNSDPEVVLVECCYQTAYENAVAVATAQTMAQSSVDGRPYRVVFLNNRGNAHTGAKSLSKSVVPSGSDVIFLDTGSSAHISTSSYGSAVTDVRIPYKTSKRTCDTAITIKISGINSENPGPSVSSRADPIMELNSILTKFRSGQMTFELADIDVTSGGHMFPTAMKATILVNSYDLEDIQSYLDDRVDNFKKDNSDKYPEIDYTYDVVSDESLLPDRVWSSSSVNSLNTFLYVVKNSNYKFDEENSEIKIPEGSKDGDIFASNCVDDINVRNGKIHVTVDSTAMNEDLMHFVLRENKAAAHLAKASAKVTEKIPSFSEKNVDLVKLVRETYSGTNDVTSKDITLKSDVDSYFTICSILKELQPDADIVHICEDEDSGVKITNTLLNIVKGQHSLHDVMFKGSSSVEQ